MATFVVSCGFAAGGGFATRTPQRWLASVRRADAARGLHRPAPPAVAGLGAEGWRRAGASPPRTPRWLAWVCLARAVALSWRWRGLDRKKPDGCPPEPAIGRFLRRVPRGRWRWPRAPTGAWPAGSGPVITPGLPRD